MHRMSKPDHLLKIKINRSIVFSFSEHAWLAGNAFVGGTIKFYNIDPFRDSYREVFPGIFNQQKYL